MARAERPAPDAPFLAPDEYFVATSLLGNNSYIYVKLARQLQAPAAATKGQGRFLLVADGKELWTARAWRTRIATREDPKLCQEVFISHETEPGTSAYRGAASRNEARRTRGWMAKVTDTSDLFKGIVTVAGSYRNRSDAMRIAPPS